MTTDVAPTTTGSVSAPVKASSVGVAVGVPAPVDPSPGVPPDVEASEPELPAAPSVGERSVGGAVVGVGVTASSVQPVLVIVLLIIVTAPVRARRRPSTVAVESSEIDSSAMIVPTKSEADPSVAELPTFQ